MESASFNVFVSDGTFKFHSSHFVAFDGFREGLHGHNYRTSVRLIGNATSVGRDGYVIDYGIVKQVCRRVCKSLHGRFLCPMHSDVIVITKSKDSIRLECQDGSIFVFPLQDCTLLPIVHATTEEIAIYIWSELLEGLGGEYLTKRGIHTMEVTVTEAPSQEATFRLGIADALKGMPDAKLDVRTFITKGALLPMPCQELQENNRTTCCPNCQGQSSVRQFSKQLKRIATAINNGTLSGSNVSPEDLVELLKDSK